MTKAEMMARAFSEVDPNNNDDLMSEVQAYFVFDDGSVLSAWDSEPVTLVVKDGKVFAAVFDND